MNTKIKCALMFAAGAAVGSAATWKFVQAKYEKIAQEEIESVKEAFSRPKPEITLSESEPEKIPEGTITKSDLMGYAAELGKNGYTNYSNPSEDNKERDEDTVERPYVISPEDFGEFYDYDKISLTHYSDNVLTDENDEIVDNVDDTVGSDYADHFGDYEDDAVHIRNDRLKNDYEILRDLRKYSDVTGVRPHWME